METLENILESRITVLKCTIEVQNKIIKALERANRAIKKEP